MTVANFCTMLNQEVRMAMTTYNLTRSKNPLTVDDPAGYKIVYNRPWRSLKHCLFLCLLPLTINPQLGTKKKKLTGVSRIV